MPPLQRPLRAHHIDLGTADLADGNLGGPELSRDAAFQFQQNGGVGLQRQMSGVGIQHGQKPFDAQARKLHQKLFGVSTQISRAEGVTHHFRMETPRQFLARLR